jgi:uncharacterized membrane protein
MHGLRTATLIAATVTVGMMAGLFATFSYAIMPGLGRADDRTFVTAMQRINEAILNGWFAVNFIGAIVFAVLAAALNAGSGQRAVLPWIGAAVVLYAAVLVITFALNVPLNDRLASAGVLEQATDLAAVRQRFEAQWVRWNIVRAVASTGAFGALIWALVSHGRLTG